MFHSITGPVRGHFIAAYACPVGEFGEEFIGYFKLFPHLPKCFCERRHVAEGVGFVGPLVSARLALADGEAEGRRMADKFEVCSQWDTGMLSTTSGTLTCTCKL